MLYHIAINTDAIYKYFIIYIYDIYICVCVYMNVCMYVVEIINTLKFNNF